jgi:hypothetical protein
MLLSLARKYYSRESFFYTKYLFVVCVCVVFLRISREFERQRDRKKEREREKKRTNAQNASIPPLLLPLRLRAFALDRRHRAFFSSSKERTKLVATNPSIVVLGRFFFFFSSSSSSSFPSSFPSSSFPYSGAGNGGKRMERRGDEDARETSRVGAKIQQDDVRFPRTK